MYSLKRKVILETTMYRWLQMVVSSHGDQIVRTYGLELALLFPVLSLFLNYVTLEFLISTLIFLIVK